MCIIVIKQAGKAVPSREILDNCFSNNDDGAGIMYTYENKVIIEKGFMTKESFFNHLEQLKNKIDTKKTPIIFHFRIGTQGGNTKSNCHPFPISRVERSLKALRYTTSVGVVHNGIIRHCVNDEQSISDTMIYIRDHLSYISKASTKFYKNRGILKMIEKSIGSKMALLTKDGEIITIGKFIKKNGIEYSNHTFSYNLLDYVAKRG